MRWPSHPCATTIRQFVTVCWLVIQVAMVVVEQTSNMHMLSLSYPVEIAIGTSCQDVVVSTVLSCLNELCHVADYFAQKKIKVNPILPRH